MSEWEVKRLDEVADRVTVKNSSGHQRVLTVAAGRGLVDQESYFNKRVASADLSGYWVVEPGDFVYNKSASKDAPWGVVARWDGDEPAVVTSLYIVFRARPSIDSDYLLHACNGTYFFDSLRGKLREGARAHGLLNVRLAEFFGAQLVIPSPAEQRRIVDVITAVDMQIEALEVEVEHAERVLEAMLTMEMFAGTEWQSYPFADVIDFREGPGIMARDFHDDGVPLIRLAGLTQGERILAKCNHLDPQKVDEKWSHFRVELGDVLLSTSAALGRVAVVDAEAVGAIPYTGIIRMRPATDLVEPSYIPWLLRSADFGRQIADAGVGTTMAHFGPTHLRKMSAPLPSVEKQLDIAKTLQSMLSSKLVIADELSQLRSFRSALLTSLLNYDIDIPESYDALLEGVL